MRATEDRKAAKPVSADKIQCRNSELQGQRKFCQERPSVEYPPSISFQGKKILVNKSSKKGADLSEYVTFSKNYRHE